MRSSPCPLWPRPRAAPRPGFPRGARGEGEIVVQVVERPQTRVQPAVDDRGLVLVRHQAVRAVDALAQQPGWQQSDEPTRIVLMLAILARTLGKAGFGELAILQSTVGMFSVFAGFGLGLTSTKYIAELRWSDPQRAARISAVSLLVGLCTGAVTALIMFLFSDVLHRTTEFPDSYVRWLG